VSQFVLQLTFSAFLEEKNNKKIKIVTKQDNWKKGIIDILDKGKIMLKGRF